jgi:hypothetical protein
METGMERIVGTAIDPYYLIQLRAVARCLP